MVKLVGYLNQDRRTLTLWKHSENNILDESTRMERMFEREFLEKNDVKSPCDIVEITIDPAAEKEEDKFVMKLVFSYRYQGNLKKVKLYPELDFSGVNEDG